MRNLTAARRRTWYEVEQWTQPPVTDTDTSPCDTCGDVTSCSGGFQDVRGCDYYSDAAGPADDETIDEEEGA